MKEKLKNLKIFMIYYMSIEDLNQVQEMINEAYDALKVESEQSLFESAQEITE